MFKEFLCPNNWFDKTLVLVAILAVFLITNILYVFGRMRASIENQDGDEEHNEDQNVINKVQNCSLTKVTKRQTV